MKFLASRLLRQMLDRSTYERRASIGGPLWVFLAVALAAPFPMFSFVLPERAVPVMWLLVAGFALAASRLARVSWPLAALLGWAALRAAYHNFPLRSLQVLALLLMAAFLYVAARDVTDHWARRVAWAILVGIAYEGVFGALNAFGWYPFMAWVVPEHVGKPMGFLTHPNYWGSFMALGLPVVWALVGIPATLLVGALILKTVSGGPVISAAVGVLVMAWPLFGRSVRWAVAGGGVVAIAVTMTLHEWRLSGRWEVWQAALGDLWRWPWPLLGEGLGQWRVWAEDFNRARGSAFATLQAHNEPYQLWFELGVVGMLFAGLWALQAWLSVRVVWRAAPAGKLPGTWWQFGRAPLERAWIAVLAVAAVNSLGSPVFHLPAQAAIILFALARVQADAAAYAERPTPSRKARRLRAQRPGTNHAGRATRPVVPSISGAGTC